MTTISRVASLMVMAAVAAGLGGCMHAEDPLTQYTQRTGKVTMSAGNAMNANAAIHMIDPWPRASANRNIPANGQRMSEAYERYRDVNKQPPKPMINPVQAGTATGTGGAASSGGGTSTATK